VDVMVHPAPFALFLQSSIIFGAFGSRYVSAIVLRVAFGFVDPVDSHCEFVTVRHGPQKERVEVFQPLVADRNSARAVPLVQAVIWVIAPTDHAPEFAGEPLELVRIRVGRFDGVSPFDFGSIFPGTATGKSLTEGRRREKYFLPAVAPGKPHYVAPPIEGPIVEIKASQHPVPPTGQVIVLAEEVRYVHSDCGHEISVRKGAASWH
jgi:hypothetical protein